MAVFKRARKHLASVNVIFYLWCRLLFFMNPYKGLKDANILGEPESKVGIAYPTSGYHRRR